ncbi:MAG: hypothetical protein QMD94_00675 [Candidatus Omnitrophota bacterium]|nr:hypothetical protein [Candidatus Omnitrophota bacterium]
MSKMAMYLNKKGQSTLEYGIIIAVVVAGLLAMQMYIKRGVQGKLRGAADNIGEQFAPEHTTGKRTTTTISESKDELIGGDEPTSTSETTGKTTETGNETVGSLKDEKW